MYKSQFFIKEREFEIFLKYMFLIIKKRKVKIVVNISGEGGIRTPGSLAATTVFKTAAFNHSATSPKELQFRTIIY